MILTESGEHQELARLAQSAYEILSNDREVPYGILSKMLGEASGKGVLRALQGKYSGTAYNAMLIPICREIDRQKPVPPRRRTGLRPESADPLTADIYG